LWIKTYFTQLNLAKALTEITGPLSMATHNCGTAPIDSIFVSSELLPHLTGGYLEFKARIPSDHCTLWINLPGVVLGFDEEFKLHTL